MLVLGLVVGLSGMATRAANGAVIDSDGALTIHPGETISIAFSGDDDFSNPKPAADTGTSPTMTFTFRDEAPHGQTLYIQSNLAVALKYDVVRVMRDGRSVHGPSCPVPAGVLVILNWTDPITELKLSGFRKLDRPGKACN